jgi:hypothetical protein
MTTFESTVRNDLWLPALDRRDLDATLTCEASNSNLSQPLTTSITIDLLRNSILFHLNYLLFNSIYSIG